MCQTGRAAALAVILVATAFNANAEDGDIATGHALAREACKACHMVEAEERSSRVIVIGPAFRNIANTPDDGDGPQSLPHRHAPEDAKSDPHAEEIADVSAYILSLRNHS